MQSNWRYPHPTWSVQGWMGYLLSWDRGTPCQEGWGYPIGKDGVTPSPCEQTHRQTRVKTLPFLILRMRVVIMHVWVDVKTFPETHNLFSGFRAGSWDLCCTHPKDGEDTVFTGVFLSTGMVSHPIILQLVTWPSQYTPPPSGTGHEVPPSRRGWGTTSYSIQEWTGWGTPMSWTGKVGVPPPNQGQVMPGQVTARWNTIQLYFTKLKFLNTKTKSKCPFNAGALMVFLFLDYLPRANFT